MLLAALGSVRIGKSCDLGLENVAPGSIFKTSVTVFPYTDLPAGTYMLLAGREVRIGKNCAKGLEYGPRPQAEGHTQD